MLSKLEIMTKKELFKKISQEAEKKISILGVLEACDKLKIKYKFLYQEGKDFYFGLKYKNKKVFLYNSSIHRNLEKLSSLVSSDKDFVKLVLAKQGVKTPRGFVANNLSEIKKKFKQEKMNFPVVLKPGFAASGRGVNIDLSNWKEISAALKDAQSIDSKKRNKPVIVEEYFYANDFRLLVLQGKFIACAERSRPQIIGDGKNKIKDLIKKQLRTTGKDRFVIDQQVKNNIKEQGYSINEVLPKNKSVILRKNANISTGGLAINRTSEVCHKYKKIAEQCAKEFDMQVAGVDILTKDISDPKGDYRVIEINTLPGFFTMHDQPDIGKSEHVTEQILKAVFKIK